MKTNEDLKDSVQLDDENASLNKKKEHSNYHISQNKTVGTLNYKKWRIRKAGSDKTIKFFDTKKEALDYASNLSMVGAKVVIHKRDGSFMETRKIEKKVTTIEPLVKEEPSERSFANKYHISRESSKINKNFGLWRIRKEGSDKTIKYFDTQKEAIEYSKILNENTGRTVAIHKKTGSIRKHIKKNDK